MNKELMSKKILAIDDDTDMRETIVDVLKYEGYQAFGATSGSGGIIVNDKENPDLIILDLRMQEMDGIETLRQIRKTDDKVRVIILTGYGNPDIAKEMVDLDISECLIKPVENDQLLHVIRYVLGR